MAKTGVTKGREPSFRVVHRLLTLLTGLSGVSDELERARLTATGLPSLFPCRVSGLALFDEVETSWRLILQQDGQQLASSLVEEVLAELEPLLQEAFRQPTLFITMADSETASSRLPPSMEKLGVQCLAVAPLMTLRSRLGMLLVGKARRYTFSQEDEVILTALGGQSALGIENLRLYQRLQQYSERLQQQNELILSSAGEGIFGLDSDGNITFVNPAALQMLGWTSDELLGKPTHDVHHHTKADGSPYPRDACPISATFKDGKVHRVDDEVFWRKDGSSFPVEYTSTPIREHGKLVGAVVVFWDITERKRAEDQLRRALAEVERLTNQLQAENVYLQEEIKLAHNFEDILSHSAAMQQVLYKVEQVAATDATVLILGETGTGKELLARAVHNLSPRKERPLVKINCAALPANLIESELFGHEKGAFTGAVSRRSGRFELAHQGTIFLDEIGDLPLDLQAKLLRVLQEGEFERLGDSRPIRVDVRIIAATNRDLPQAITDGAFRQDLYYRLNVFPLTLPPLRERVDDIRLLVHHFTQQYGAKMGKRIEQIPHAVMAALQAYAWPGNVRELENIIERAVILTSGSTLELDESLIASPRAQVTTQHGSTLQEVERDHICQVLEDTAWRIEGPHGAAVRLGLKPSTLRSRMQKLGITNPPRVE
jgi:PAS domain S-box-containing protein